MKPKSQDVTVSGFKELAIIGATASGKSALAIEIAQKYGGVIFSIDSLAVYKEMDIVSAKPTRQEQQGIEHFGIDTLEVTEQFSAAKLADIYAQARQKAEAEKKILIIVGGSSFYLKALLDGLSPLPEFSQETLIACETMMHELPKVYKLLREVDPESVQKIDPNDRYRLEKLLLVYLQTKQPPSSYYADHPPTPVIEDLALFEIETERSLLRERIAKRTRIMIETGLIDEIASLEAKFGRAAHAMKAIGVIETLQFLDAQISKDELETLITTHTAQLAKRQTTFNKTQFQGVVRAPVEELFKKIEQFVTN